MLWKHSRSHEISKFRSQLYSPDVRRLHAGEAGGLHHRVRVLPSNLQLGRLVVTVRLDDAHVVLVLGGNLLILLKDEGIKSLYKSSFDVYEGLRIG